ncbi:MAG TPA: hypothetical protein VGA97_04430, partial [Acidimicrobiia bacterium]
PLLQHRIEHEVAKHDLTGPEGRARALHAAAAQVRRVNDEIARREYTRYVSRLVGVDLATAERAIASGRATRSGSGGVAHASLDRSEAELFRVILFDPSGRSEVNAGDFTDPRLHGAYLALAPQLAEGATGEVDVSMITDPDARAVVLALMMDDRPLPEWSDVENLLKLRRLDVKIDEVQTRIADLEQGSEAHSEALHQLIALQQERQSLGYT